MPLLLHDPAASWLAGAAAVALVAGEVGATYLGQARDGGVVCSGVWRSRCSTCVVVTPQCTEREHCGKESR